MIRYKNTQVGWFIILFSFAIGAILLIICILQKDTEHLKKSLLGGAFIIFAGLLVFNSLTTVVTDESFKAYFGNGLIHKTIPLKEISECRIVQNSFIWGWGIRFGMGFTLWNVSGFNSVELTLKDKKWKFRIGTDKPEELLHAITSILKEQQFLKIED
jgi:hypothetical protein